MLQVRQNILWLTENVLQAKIIMLQPTNNLLPMSKLRKIIKENYVSMKKQTAGRDQLGQLAPQFAALNDDVLFGEI